MSKYFHEAGKGSHYDKRFFIKEIPIKDKKKILMILLKEFVKILKNTDIKPILMHGGLIGWAWNKKLLPWDQDIDLCLLYDDLDKLNSIQNEVQYDHSKFILDINPYYINRNSKNKNNHESKEPNKIDARFIDKKNGLYIDITALYDINLEYFITKCPHKYKKVDILPLREDKVDGIDIFVPNNTPAVLIQEYGKNVLGKPEYKEWKFNFNKGIWEKKVSTPNIKKIFIQNSLYPKFRSLR
jgi:hypothetical protein